MKHEKAIVIINGKGGTGKDTLIKALMDSIYDEDSIKVISAIDPIKDIARNYGYDDNNKDLKSRKFLSDLKSAFIEFNDYPSVYLMREVSKMLREDKPYVLFVHIREPEEIIKFKNMVEKEIESLDNNKCNVVTLLIRRKDINKNIYGNSSDDRVEEYDYDFIFNNDKSISKSSMDFILFFSENILQSVAYM